MKDPRETLLLGMRELGMTIGGTDAGNWCWHLPAANGHPAVKVPTSLHAAMNLIEHRRYSTMSEPMRPLHDALMARWPALYPALLDHALELQERYGARYLSVVELEDR